MRGDTMLICFLLKVLYGNPSAGRRFAKARDKYQQQRLAMCAVPLGPMSDENDLTNRQPMSRLHLDGRC
eukprot:SAG11_NODE_69_length_18453_cov_37.601613_8_plen_69_part_00